MLRRFVLFFVLSGIVLVSALGQSVPILPTLASFTHELEAHPDGFLDLSAHLGEIVNAASLAEIQQVMPALIGLTESPNQNLRAGALIVLASIAIRQKPGLPENRSETDTSGGEVIVPYILRLKPRIMDKARPDRGLCLSLFRGLALIRPTPPVLLNAVLAMLQDPQSTKSFPDTTDTWSNGKIPSLGPHLLSILLLAGATYYIDPATNITEGRDSPEVQEAIIAFLNRRDQTAESLTESIRELALAQPQNPEVNGQLVRLLDSPEVAVQEALLQDLNRLTLNAGDFVTARTRVESLAADPATPAAIKQLANSVLPCWANDRHRGTCPPLAP